MNKPPVTSTMVDALKQASATATDFLENDPRAKEITAITKARAQEWTDEAAKFIRQNPWVAVLGAAAIGYYLGSTRNRSSSR